MAKVLARECRQLHVGRPLIDAIEAVAQSCRLHANGPVMAKKSEKHQASALDEVSRHVRVFVDLGRVAGESN